MRALKAVWGFIVAIVGGVWGALGSIRRAIGAVIVGLFEPPASAIRRVFRSFKEKLWQLVQTILAAWARVFQRAPKTPRDRIPTPGRQVLPMWGAVVSSLWYLVPWNRWFELSAIRFELIVYGTAIVAAMLVRRALRAEPRGWLGRFAMASSRSVGLIWLERFSLAGVAVAFWVLRGQQGARPLLVVSAIALIALLVTAYEPRVLADELPALPDLDTDAPDGSITTRRFDWSLKWDGRRDDFSVVLDIDTDRFFQMQSMNPIAPPGGRSPDFSPWVVDGTTSEVDRVAKAIRDRCNDLSYTRFQEATATLAFAQSVEYQSDEVTTDHVDYWRYPIETLYEQTGDCEDTTIAALAVLRRLGHNVLPLTMPGHAALGVEAPVTLKGSFVTFDGYRYYYCETTAEGFAIGQIPDGVDPASIAACPLRLPS